MSRIRVAGFSISLEGFGAGPNQSLENPMGEGGTALHQWAFPTRTFHAMQGKTGGTNGIDDEFAVASFDNVGAWVLGRNMFGPVRGSWGDFSWKGWWGDSPPYHVPVFVLTHNPRPPLEMQGGTTFHFVTDGIEAALARAREAAAGRDVRIGGGVSTIRQYLRAGLIDELHLVQSAVLLGRGESLLHDIDLRAQGFETVRRVPGDHGMHVVLARHAR